MTRNANSSLTDKTVVSVGQLIYDLIIKDMIEGDGVSTQ